MKSLLSLPLLLALPVGEALASEGSLGISVSGGAVITDPLEVLDDTWVVVPRLAWWHNPTLAIELEAGFSQGRTSVGVPDTFAYTAISPRIGITGRVFHDQPLNVLLSAGVGGVVKSIADEGALELPTGDASDFDFLAHAGPGLMLPIGSTGLALRTDLRYVVNLGTESYQNRGDAFLNWEWTAGVSFGVPTKPDADRDGYADAEDKCPDAAEDVDGFQDDDGCPDPDNDGDGIGDADDRCPNEAEDRDDRDDADGCPDPDDDRDGVPDEADRCPDARETINGVEDDDGCPDRGGRSPWTARGGGDLPELRGRIGFENDGSIAGASSGAIDQLARHLVARWGARWIVAIAPGPAGREAALASALESRGVPRGRVEIVVDEALRGPIVDVRRAPGAAIGASGSAPPNP